MNLVKLLTDQFGGQIVKGIAGNLGVGEKDARSSMEGALPSILGGLINKVGTSSGADELYDVVNGKDYDGGMLNNLGSLFGGGTNSSLLKTGAGLLPMIFGGRSTMGNVIDIAGRVFGGGASRQRSVLSMLAPLVISFIGKRLRGGNNMNKSGLIDLLTGQKRNVVDAAHPEIAKELGFGNWASGNREVRTESTAHRTEYQEEKKGGGFLKWLLPLLLLGGLGLFLMRSCGGDAEVKKTTTKTEQIDRTEKPATKAPVKQNTQTPPPAKQNIQKPVETKQPVKTAPKANTPKPKAATNANAPVKTATAAAGSKVYTGEAKMFQDAANANKSTVVNFGSLSPDGKALSEPARKKLDLIAEIMQQTPALNIEVRGHNKDHGNKIKNTPARAASKVRAGLVQAYLQTKGVKGNRIKTTSIGHDELVQGIAPDDDKQKRITIKTVK